MNGAMECVNVTVNRDDLVECEEEFTLELTLNSSKDSLSLGNNVTVMTLVDSDGMQNVNTLNLQCYHLCYNCIIVASFSIPLTETVSESDMLLEICVTLSTEPSSAELATSVSLALASLSSTGLCTQKGKRHLYEAKREGFFCL